MSLAEPDAMLAPPTVTPPADDLADDLADHMVQNAAPPLRLLPAPPSAPPFDDELPAFRQLRLLPGRAVGSANLRSAAISAPPAPATTDALPATAPAVQSAPPLTDTAGPALRLVPAGDDVADRFDEPERSRPRTPLSHLPAPRPFAHAFVQRLLEVLAGLRPMSQLQRDTTFELFEELQRTVVGRPRTTGPRPSRRDVRSVHVQQRADGVAEVCATVHRGGRATAIALRLEGVDGAWRCTALVGV